MARNPDQHRLIDAEHARGLHGAGIISKRRMVEFDALCRLGVHERVLEVLAECILSAARAMPEGGLLSPKEFLHLGSRAAIDKTLSRLAQEGKLLRVGRGAYVAPQEGRFGARPPSTESVLRAIEAICGETVVANGAAEANAMGLSTQVPIREVFLTSGTSRTLHLGSRCVELKHGKRWQILLGKRPAGKVIRALSWLGPEGAPAALKQLRTKLPESEWEAVRGARAALPRWMAKALSEAMAPDAQTPDPA